MPLRRNPLLLACLGLFTASQVQAGGLWITEYGQPSMGRAGAGDAAGTDDATTALFNPAAMSRLQKSELTVTAGVAIADIKFEVEQGSLINGNKDSGSAGGPGPIASAFYVHPINDRWTLGVAAVGLTGSVLDYNDDWAGRFQSQDVSLLVAGVVPGVSYRVNEKLSLGFSLPVMYSALEMNIAIPNFQEPVLGEEGKAEIDGDDVQVAGTASFLYEFSEQTRIGGRYTSKFEFEYDGDIKASRLGAELAATTEMTLAAIARVGLSHDINETWSAYATVGWDNWSQLGDVLLTAGTRGVALPSGWEDTYHYSIGADYRLDERWTLRAGTAYDSSPVDAKERTADLPVDEQWRFAFGADYRRDSGMLVSTSLVYADYGDSKIDSSKRTPLIGYKGEYKENQIWFASVAFNWPLGGASR
jgi:long-chain fatty acid transport protein